MLPPRIRKWFRLPLRDDPALRAAPRAEELYDEIRLHLDLRIEQLTARGIPPDEARDRALAKFGPLPEARTRLDAANQHRENQMYAKERLEALKHDIRIALRSLRRRPTFSAAVVLTLALGVGANATMFGIIDRLMLRAPDFLTAPERTGRVYLWNTPATGKAEALRYWQYRTFLDLAEGTRSLSHIAAFTTGPQVLGDGKDAREESVTLASGNFWSLFDARPVVGRFFGPSDDALPTGQPVIVISYATWRSRFGADSGVVGRTLRFGRSPFTIIGVAPPGFNGVELSPVGAWIPLTAAGNENFGTRQFGGFPWHQTYLISWIEVIARRKPGISVAQANADLSAAYSRSYQTYFEQRPASRRAPELANPWAELASIHSDRGPTGRAEAKVAVWLGGVALLVLLIACANVASLLLARAMERRRELAVRVALGGSRARLISSTLLEGMLLALLGGALGVVAATLAGGALRSAMLPELDPSASLFNTVLDGRVLVFALVASLAAGLLSSLAPALHASGSDVAGMLRAGARGGGGRQSRLRAGLLVVQGTLSVLLLVGAGLFVRSLHNVRTLDVGYDARELAYLTIDLRGMQLDPAEMTALRERVRQRALGLPGVGGAAVTLSVPYRFVIGEEIRVPGLDSASLPDYVSFNAVSPDYFRVAGTPIQRGRAFSETDRVGTAPVVVISESLAERIWPGQLALGRCIKVGADTAPCSEVVGIATNVRMSLTAAPALHLYVPAAQGEHHRAGLYIRTRGDARPLAATLRRELQPLMPGPAFIKAIPVQEIVDPTFRSWQLGATMFTVFGLLALLVAAVGLYSVIAYNVAQRTHELGVRIALGAQAGDVLRMVVSEGLRVSAIAIAMGLGLALIAGKWVKPLLFGVSERDPATFAAVAMTLMVVATAASFIPARRASRVDPTESFRAD